MSRLLTADLFSGLGGTSTGAVEAGASVAWAANHWPEAVEWHSRNHPETLHLCQDLMEMDWTQAGEVDVLLASPACQGRSNAGQPARKGTGGSHRPDPKALEKKHRRDRNTAWACIAAADCLQPRLLVIENVPQFVHWAPKDSPKDGRTFRAWRGALEGLGYQTQLHVLNGLDYGGAQDRPRMILTARLDGPAPVLAASTGAVAGAIGDCLDPDSDPGNRWREIDGCSERMRTRMRKAQNEAGARCFWNNVSEARGRRLDEPCPTSTTQSGTQWNLLDGDRCRVMNPREIARSMSFPETYQLPPQRELAGNLIGNAMDVRLARGIVEQLAAA